MEIKKVAIVSLGDSRREFYKKREAIVASEIEKVKKAFGDKYDLYISPIVFDTEDGQNIKMGTPKGKVVNSVGAGDSMVAGFVTSNNGHFSLAAPMGRYLLKISFVGYKSEYKPLVLSKTKPRVLLGQVQLHSGDNYLR